MNLQTMAQSKESDKVPKPSLAIDPPKKFVTNRLFLIVKQKMETPARSGTGSCQYIAMTGAQVRAY
jgi:hypothetical protein